MTQKKVVPQFLRVEVFAEFEPYQFGTHRGAWTHDLKDKSLV